MFFSKRVEVILFVIVLLAGLFFYSSGSHYTGNFLGIFDDFFGRGSPEFLEEGCVYDNGGGEGSLVYLNKPYEDSVVSGYTDIGDYSNYEWRVDGEAVASGDDGQLVLFHFDDSLDSSDGLSPTNVPEDATYSSGKFGNGLDMSEINSRVEYENFDKFDPSEGTVEMWLIFQEGSYGGNPFFRYRTQMLDSAWI